MTNKYYNISNVLRHVKKDGVDLYYDAETNLTGTSINGLARLTGCDKKLIQRKAVSLKVEKDAQTQTRGGVQGVSLITESDIPKVLKTITNSKRTSEENKQKATDALSKFAQAGFRLMTLLEVAPDVVAKTAINHVEKPEEAESVKRYADQHAKYLETYHGLTDALQDKGAQSKDYAAVNGHNNKLVGVKKGKRKEMSIFQKDAMTFIQLAEKMKLEQSNVDAAWQAVNVAKRTGDRTQQMLAKILES